MTNKAALWCIALAACNTTTKNADPMNTVVYVQPDLAGYLLVPINADMAVAAVDMATTQSTDMAQGACPAPPDFAQPPPDMTPPTCGYAVQQNTIPCCANNDCGPFAVCYNNKCLACGFTYAPVCPNGRCYAYPSVAQTAGSIYQYGTCNPCGQSGQPCCNQWDTGYYCFGSMHCSNTANPVLGTCN